MKKILSLALALVLMISFGTVAMAAINDYDFIYTLGLNDVNTYTVEAGGELMVPVYLFETANPEDTYTSRMSKVEVNIPAGFTITEVVNPAEDGELGYDFNYGSNADGSSYVLWMLDGRVRVSNEEPILEITMTAPAAAGSYTLTNVGQLLLCDSTTTDVTTQGKTVGFNGATVTVTGGAAATDVVVANPSTAAQNGYTANAFKDGAEVRELTIFAKAENATAAGIEIALDNGAAPAAADWTLAADGIGTDGTFAVSAYEIKADGATADYEVLTTANVWARAYATGANGTVYSAWIKY